MKNFTDITVLVDRSGSMQYTRKAMEEAYSGFLQEHRKVSSTKITLIQFDGGDSQDVVYTAVPVADAGQLHINPRGSTPLIDALCKTIDATGARLRSMDEKHRPSKVILVVITDGQENASHLYNRAELSGRISKQQSRYNWQFVYLGSNVKAVEDALDYGFSRGGTAFFAGEDAGYQNMGQAVACNTMSYVTGQSTGVAAFTADQRSKMADEKDKNKA